MKRNNRISTNRYHDDRYHKKSKLDSPVVYGSFIVVGLAYYTYLFLQIGG